MALNGKINVVVTSQDTLEFSWAATQSIEKNQSTVSWILKLIAGSAGYIQSSASKKWSVTVNGTTYSGTNTIGINNNATKILASGSTVITHNSDGSKIISYSFSQEIAINWGNTYIGTKTGSGTGTLDTIPRQAIVSTAPNFNDEDNPTITYSNSAGDNVTSLQACIADVDGQTVYVPYRDISKTETSYTFNLTTAERNTLRNACVNSKSMTIRFYIRTIMDGNSYFSYLDKTLTIVNANPTLNPNLYVPDTSDTYRVTGSTTKFIKNYTWVSYNTNATALKGATIKSYKVTCGSFTATEGSGRIDGAMSTANVVFTVTDSRGYTSTKTVQADLIDYISLTCNLNANLNSDGKITFDVSGNYYNGNLGATDNTLTVEVRYKVKGGSYSSWASSTASISGNTYKLGLVLSGMDYTQTYIVQARAIDKLATITSMERTLSCFPIFDWSDSDFNFNVPVFLKSATINGVDVGKAINSIKYATAIDSSPTETYSYFWTASSNFLCGDITIQRYTKGVFITNGGSDGIILGVDFALNLYIGFRSSGTWTCRTI